MEIQYRFTNRRKIVEAYTLDENNNFTLVKCYNVIKYVFTEQGECIVLKEMSCNIYKTLFVLRKNDAHKTPIGFTETTDEIHEWCMQFVKR